MKTNDQKKKSANSFWKTLPGTLPEHTYHGKQFYMAETFVDGRFKRIILSDNSRVAISLLIKRDHYLIFNYAFRLPGHKMGIFDIRKITWWPYIKKLDLVNTKPIERLTKISEVICKMDAEKFNKITFS